jgi:hypothetical protein
LPVRLSFDEENKCQNKVSEYVPFSRWELISYNWIEKLEAQPKGLRLFCLVQIHLGQGKELIRDMNYPIVLPVLTGAAEDKRGTRLRRNPKRAGEISEAAFVLRAHSLGFLVAKPWGDSEKYDFVLDAGAKLWRVQLKSTEAVHARGYERAGTRGRRDTRRRRLMRWWCTFSRVMCGT